MEQQRPTRVINAAPSLEKAEMYGIDDNRPVFSRAMALVGRMFIETIPQWIAVGAMLSLIFGGCCSNVFALEAIIKVEPGSGRFFLPFEATPRYQGLTGYRNTSDVCSIPVRGHHRVALAVRSGAAAFLLEEEPGADPQMAGQHCVVLRYQRLEQPRVQL